MGSSNRGNLLLSYGARAVESVYDGAVLVEDEARRD
jgi:hypothetical protein